MKDNLEAIQDREEWGDDDGEVREPVRNRRAVVSVAFSREDFEQVSAHAAKQGMKTSEFIREAALQQVGTQPAKVIEVRISGAFHTRYPRQTEHVTRSAVKLESKDSTYTSV